MNEEPLTEDTYELFCMKNYDGGYLANIEDFRTDLNRVKYIKKLIARYKQKGELKERLILNHIIVLNNVFGGSHVSRMLFLKLSPDFAIIKPFLVLLGTLPEYYTQIGTKETLDHITSTDLIPMDQKVIEALRQI